MEGEREIINEEGEINKVAGVDQRVDVQTQGTEAAAQKGNGGKLLLVE